MSTINTFLTKSQEVFADPIIEKPPLPISEEFDLMAGEFFSKIQIDRSKWLQKCFEDDLGVKEYYERVNPVARAYNFGFKYLPTSRHLSQVVLLSLVSQHLRTLGLVESQSCLHDEWEGKFDIPAHMRESQLTMLIQRGILRVEKFWELCSSSQYMKPDDFKKAMDEEISQTIGGAPIIEDDSSFLVSEIVGDSNHIRLSPDGSLHLATLNQLILLLTSESTIDINGIASAFFFSYKSIVSSRNLFSRIRERFRLAVLQKDQYAIEKTTLLISIWLKKAKSEIEQPIIEALKFFYQNEILLHHPKAIPIYFDKKISAFEYVVNEAKAPRVVLGKCIDTIWTGGFSLLDLPEIELARQMTIWTCRKYYSFHRSEFLNGAWEQSRLKHRAPNIVSVINHVNAVCNWVSFSILSEKSTKKRINIWIQFVELMRHLYQMRNFCDAFAISGGLQSNEIYRLVQHRKLLPKATIDFMYKMNDTLVNGGTNMKLVRELHNEARLKDEPAIPFFAVLLSDLFKYIQVVESVVEGMINITRCKKTYLFIKNIEVYKKNQYSFMPIEQIQQKIDSLLTYDPSLLMEMSMEAESNEATEESIQLE